MPKPRPVWLLPLALGVLANVAVALLCALRPAYTGYGDVDRIADWPRAVPETWPAPDSTMSHRSSRSSARFTAQGSADAGRFHHQVISQYGFPFRALETEYRHVKRRGEPGTIERLADAGPVPAVMGPGYWPQSPRVPTRPLWPGFLLNTLLYGAVLAVPLLPLALRRRLRRRRRRCPECGYPVGSSSCCTECGHALPGVSLATD